MLIVLLDIMVHCVFLAFCRVFLRLLIVAFRKKERAAADARSPAGRRYRDANTVLAYVRCFFECCLYANVWELSGKLWFLMITLQLQGGLSAICSWTVLLLFYILFCSLSLLLLPLKEMLFREGREGVIHVVLRCCLFGGCGRSVPCIALS